MLLVHSNPIHNLEVSVYYGLKSLHFNERITVFHVHHLDMKVRQGTHTYTQEKMEI